MVLTPLLQPDQKMKISSRYKDYYDYVEYLYSPKGGDSRSYYLRNEILFPESHPQIRKIPYSSNHYISVGGFYPYLLRVRSWRLNDFPWELTWCSVCGKSYLLVADFHPVYRTLTPYKILTEDHPAFLAMQNSNPWGFFNNLENHKKLKISDLVGVSSDVCVNLAKMLQAPVFYMDSITETSRSYSRDNSRLSTTYEVCVSSAIPVLQDLGFPALIPAEQMYQEIAMFMTQLREPPDDAPPTSISDKDRLLQRGFDKKLSFRGKAK